MMELVLGLVVGVVAFQIVAACLGLVKFDPHDLWFGVYWKVEKLKPKGQVRLPIGDFRLIGIESSGPEKQVLKYEKIIEEPKQSQILKLYICLIPMFPICIKIRLGPLPHSGDVAPQSGLIESEQTVMSHLVAAWAAFVNLNGKTDDVHVFRRAIHQAQSILARRVLSRIHPDYWR